MLRPLNDAQAFTSSISYVQRTSTLSTWNACLNIKKPTKRCLNLYLITQKSKLNSSLLNKYYIFLNTIEIELFKLYTAYILICYKLNLKFQKLRNLNL